MQHSYEALDRPGGFSRVNLLHPLRHRRFLLLWAGMTVSLFGDGIFLVAMAWQVYELWNAPAALSVIGISMTVPTIACLLPGGVVSDRFDRRSVMLAADALRAAVIGLLAVLSATGSLTLWELAVLCAVYGVGTAFFNPAFDAVVPDILPADQLAAANSLDQFVRPLALRLAGPAAAGWLIAAVGLGAAFAIDAATFCVSAAALVAIGRTPRPQREPGQSAVEDVRQGYRFIRRRVWLWGTLLSAAVAYLVFLGPTEVLLPYMVKNVVHGSAESLGLVFAAGGLGAIGCALVMGQRGQPRRGVAFIYATWTLATVAVAGYGLATATWQLMLACLVFNVLETAGTIVWATLKQQHVPAELLGRVSSLDWLISIGLLPLSFALTAPAVALLGARTTLVAAGVIGAVVTASALLLPGMLELDRAAEPEPVASDEVDVVLTRIRIYESDPSALPGPRS